MPASCARSCRALRAAGCRRRRVPTVSSSTGTWRRGSRASLPTSRTRRPRISTGGWARSVASSWTSKQRLSSCRLKARHESKRLDEFKEGTAMKEQEKEKLGRRDFLRAMGAGAGLAVTAAAPLATEAVAAESDADKKKARYQANSTDVQSFYRVNRYPK